MTPDAHSPASTTLRQLVTRLHIAFSSFGNELLQQFMNARGIKIEVMNAAPVPRVAVVTVSRVYPSQTFTALNASGYVVAQRKAAVASTVSGAVRSPWMTSTSGCENCLINPCAAFSADWWKHGNGLGCGTTKNLLKIAKKRIIRCHERQIPSNS